MTLDFSRPVKDTLHIEKYGQDTIEDFSMDLNNNKSKTPAGDWLFETRKTAKNSIKNEKGVSHNDGKRILMQTRKAGYTNRNFIFDDQSQRTR